VERANYGWAVKLFREVLRHTPDHPEARAALRMTERRLLESKGGGMNAVMAPLHGLLASLKMLIAKPRKKLEICEDYLEKHPNSFWALMAAGSAARKAGLDSVAAGLVRDALRLKPDDKGGLRVASDMFREMGENAEALKYLSRLSHLNPTDRDLIAEVRDLEAAGHMAAHRVEDAESFRDMVRDKGEAESFEKSRRMAVTLDDLQGEVAQLEKELQENPKQLNRILRLAQLYVDTGDTMKAADFLKEKQELLPDNYEVREKLGDVRLQVLDGAIKAARQRCEQNADDAGAKQEVEALQKRRTGYALQEYNWRLQQHPTDGQLQMKLGELNVETGDYNQAIAMFQQLAGDARYALRVRRMLGMCFMKKGQHDLAVAQFASALENHPAMDDEGKDLRYLQAQALEGVGKTEDALQIYKNIYSQDIGFRDVAQKVETLGS
jgi:tetratricopeptide (TPR) repeat protein